MTIIVTCGPSFEPIDEVRRITNFSSGSLGVMLANRLTRDGHKVICLKGAGATYPGKVKTQDLTAFETNDDLARLLKQLAKTKKIDMVLHAAALCDFRVKKVDDDSGQSRREAKIPSRIGSLTIHLEPATKVIGCLRRLFPEAFLVGWKYELVGSREDALKKGWQQVKENRTDACIVNGRAFGSGFVCCVKPDQMEECADKKGLVNLLAKSLPIWKERCL